MKNWKSNVVLFMLTQTVSLMGSMLVSYAIMWYVTLSTQSGTMMTIMVLASTLPTLVLSPFAGVWADKLNRKAVMIVADGAIAAITLVTAILFALGFEALWMIFIVLVIRSLGQAMHHPSVSSTYQQIVPKESLMKVNGINQSLQSAMMILMPMLAALLLQYTTLQVIFMIDVITAAIAIFFLVTIVRIPKRDHEQELHTIDYFKDLNAGFKYIKEHSYLISFFVFMTLLWILISPVSFLTPLQTVRDFGPEEWRLAAIEVGFALGMMFGGIAITAWGGFKNRAVTMIVATFLLGWITASFGVITNFWLYIGMMATTGFFIPIFNTPAITMLQEQVDQEFTGRVFSVMGIIQNATMPIAMIFFGPLADLISIDYLLIITGIVLSLLGVFIYLNKAMMKAGNKV